MTDTPEALPPLPEPFAHICVLPTKDAGPTKFFTAPSDPRGFPVYTEDQFRAALAQRQQVPEGWQLVPVEPTDTMVEAARDVKRRRLLRAVEDTKAGREPNTAGAVMACGEEWAAMLAAAPALTAAPSAQEKP